MAEAATVLELRGITKSFPGTVANDLAASVAPRQLGKILSHRLRIVRCCNAAQHVNDNNAVLVFMRYGDASWLSKLA